jgi:hypothetical protein
LKIRERKNFLLFFPSQFFATQEMFPKERELDFINAKIGDCSLKEKQKYNREGGVG